MGKLIPKEVDRLRVELTMRLGALQSIGDELTRESESRESQALQLKTQRLSTGVLRGALSSNPTYRPLGKTDRGTKPI